MESEKNMEHKIVFATSNAGKMREIREILKDLGAEQAWMLILWKMEIHSRQMR